MPRNKGNVIPFNKATEAGEGSSPVSEIDPSEDVMFNDDIIDGTDLLLGMGDEDGGFDDAPEPDDEPAELEEVPHNIAVGGQAFDVEEPDMDQYSAVLRLGGEMLLRSQRVVGRVLKDVFVTVTRDRQGNERRQIATPIEATFGALLSILQPNDLKRLTAILLFGGDTESIRQGVQWLNSLPTKGDAPNRLRMEQMVGVLAAALDQSEDLFNSLKALGLLTANRRKRQQTQKSETT